MSEIVLTGLSAADPIPGVYAEIVFGAGDASSGTGTYPVLLLGDKLASGTATADTVIYGPDTTVTMTGEADAIALFGAGSELHRMVKRFLKVNQTTPLYAVAVSEGGSAAAATGTITIATTATGAATLRIYVGDEFVDVGIAPNDTVTTIAAAAVVQINAQTHWPVTAANVAGAVTIVSKQKGLRSNQIRYFAQIKPSTIGTTVSPTASTLTTGGTASDSNTTALTTILAKRFYYIVSAAEDQTQIVALLSQVNTAALPVSGIRQRIVAGSADTIANAITISTALNGARAELVWFAQSDVPPCELAANHAAVVSLEEAPTPPLLNFDSYGNDARTSGNWKIRAPLSGAAPTRSQLAAALNAGLTPIGVTTTGSTYLVRRITTRFLSGSTVDYRTRDGHIPTIMDRFTDDLVTKASLQLAGKEIADDPKRNEPVPGSRVVTPRVVLALVNRLTRDYADNDLLQRVGEIISATRVQRSVAVPTRMAALIPLRPIDCLHQLAFSVQQL